MKIDAANTRMMVGVGAFASPLVYIASVWAIKVVVLSGPPWLTDYYSGREIGFLTLLSGSFGALGGLAVAYLARKRRLDATVLAFIGAMLSAATAWALWALRMPPNKVKDLIIVSPVVIQSFLFLLLCFFSLSKIRTSRP